MLIKDHIALVTGAASGMGAATAQHLSQLGAKVILFDKNINSELQSSNNLAYEVDITNEQQVEQALNDACTRCGIPQILVNCAGIAPSKRLIGREGAMPLEHFKQVIDINLIGTFNLMRLVAEKISTLKKTTADTLGVIINTSSIAAFEGQIGQTAYAASKAGIIGLTLPAARDLSLFGIRVMTIAPGVMKTPMMAAMPEDIRKNLEATVTYPKRLGLPAEFALLVQHIIENDYLNGEVIRLDGGLRMASK